MPALPGPPTLERRGPYSWRDVSALHGGRRGIRQMPDGSLSLLLDYGLSRYIDGWEGEVLHYLGDGTVGDQQLTGGTLLLLKALEQGSPARVWERLKPNVWYDLGWLRVIGVRRRELGGRQVFEFDLVQTLHDSLEARAAGNPDPLARVPEEE